MKVVHNKNACINAEILRHMYENNKSIFKYATKVEIKGMCLFGVASEDLNVGVSSIEVVPFTLVLNSF